MGPRPIRLVLATWGRFGRSFRAESVTRSAESQSSAGRTNSPSGARNVTFSSGVSFSARSLLAPFFDMTLGVLLVPPYLRCRDDENRSKQRQQEPVGHQPEQSSTDERADDGACRHHTDEAAVLTEHGEAAVLAVAGKADEHRGQADREREAPGKLDVRSEQDDESR